MIEARCPGYRRHQLGRILPFKSNGQAVNCPDCGISRSPDDARWTLSDAQAEALTQLGLRDVQIPSQGLYGGGNRTSSGPFRSTLTLRSLCEAGLATPGDWRFSTYRITPLGRLLYKAASS